MSAKITKRDVVLYLSDQLDIERRREIEAAWEADDRVKAWFTDLTPTEEELEREAAQPIACDPNDREMREHAVTAYLSIERDDSTRALSDWFRAAAASANRITELPVQFARQKLATFPSGALAWQDAVPMTIAADNETREMEQVSIPVITANYSTRRLTIRQWAEDVPSGVVDVFAAKRLETGKVEVYGPVRVPLHRGTRPDGKTYCYNDISLMDLIGDFKPADEFFYYAEPVAAEDEAGAGTRQP